MRKPKARSAAEPREEGRPGSPRPGTAGTGLLDLPTPSLLVDLETLERNSSRMREKAKRAGVRFRPHVKTHKTIEGARLQLGAATGPITVSTLAEAEHFAAAGFDDITYAVPISPSKLARAAALARRIRRLGILIDSAAALDAIERFHETAAEGARFDVMLKVDCGYHRAGVDPDREESLALALRMARSPKIRFGGLLTHAGHSYDATSTDQIRAIAREESLALERFAEKVRAAGADPVLTSVGSTPTMSVPETLDGVAGEIRPGNYVFYDVFQAAIGSCALGDVALSVLTSVIGAYPDEARSIVDAGALALSKDRGAEHLGGDPGYGVVTDLQLVPLPLHVAALSQEHGKIRVLDPAQAARWSIGDRLRILPNHSCLTAALSDTYYVVQGDRVVAEWHPVRGW